MFLCKYIWASNNIIMNKIIILMISTLLLSSCSSEIKSEYNNNSKLLDKKIKELLPIKANKVELNMTGPNKSIITATGFIELGEKEDGSACKLFLDVKQDIKGENASIIDFQIVRSNNATWHKINKSNIKLPDGIINTWFDYLDYQAPRPAIIFSPLFITDGLPLNDNAGASFCTLRYLDQVSTLEPSSNIIKYDYKRTNEYMDVAFSNYTKNLLKAGGLNSTDIDKYLSPLVAKTKPDYTEALSGLELKIYKKDNHTIIDQKFSDNEFSLSIKFTPENKIENSLLTDIKEENFYTKLAKDSKHKEVMNKLKELGVDEWLKGISEK
jgi:hypothetical protein